MIKKLAPLIIGLVMFMSACSSSSNEPANAASPSVDQAAVDAKASADAEAKSKADAEAKIKAEEDAKRKAEEETRLKAEQEKTAIATMAKSGIENLTDNELEMQQETFDFIVNNKGLFPAKTPQDIQRLKKVTDQTIKAKNLNKNVQPYLGKIATFSGNVVNIEEQNTDAGITISIAHVIDESMQSYQIVIFKSSGDIFEGDSVRFWGVPVGPWSFSNVSGGTTKVQFFFGSHIEEIQ